MRSSRVKRMSRKTMRSKRLNRSKRPKRSKRSKRPKPSKRSKRSKRVKRTRRPALKVAKRDKKQRGGAVPREVAENLTAGRGQWDLDERVTQCTSCGTEFGLFVRRHHCRYCGKIFCDTCSDQTFTLADKPGGVKAAVRTCRPCFTFLRDQRGVRLDNLAIRTEAAAVAAIRPRTEAAQVALAQPATAATQEELTMRAPDELFDEWNTWVTEDCGGAVLPKFNSSIFLLLKNIEKPGTLTVEYKTSEHKEGYSNDFTIDLKGLITTSRYTGGTDTRKFKILIEYKTALKEPSQYLFVEYSQPDPTDANTGQINLGSNFRHRGASGAEHEIEILNIKEGEGQIVLWSDHREYPYVVAPGQQDSEASVDLWRKFQMGEVTKEVFVKLFPKGQMGSADCEDELSNANESVRGLLLYIETFLHDSPTLTDSWSPGMVGGKAHVDYEGKTDTGDCEKELTKANESLGYLINYIKEFESGDKINPFGYYEGANPTLRGSGQAPIPITSGEL